MLKVANMLLKTLIRQAGSDGSIIRHCFQIKSQQPENR